MLQRGHRAWELVLCSLYLDIFNDFISEHDFWKCSPDRTTMEPMLGNPNTSDGFSTCPTQSQTCLHSQQGLGASTGLGLALVRARVLSVANCGAELCVPVGICPGSISLSE